MIIGFRVIDDGDIPVVFKVIPKNKNTERTYRLANAVRNLKIENPALTFTRIYKMMSRGKDSEFDEYDDSQLAAIAERVNFISKFWDDPETGGEPKVNVILLLDRLLNYVIDNCLKNDEDEES